jgi:hypothetical protein
LVTGFVLGDLKPVRAEYRDDIGYKTLKEELGEGIPDGDGVSVGQVEAQSSGAWKPDLREAEFNGKQFNFVSTSSGGFSGHSTSVGRLFYGIRSSIAPGIKNIACHEAGSWMKEGFIRSGYSDPPRFTASRVVNHSWVGNAGDEEDILRRMDWVVEKDETIMVVASCLKNKPLLGAAYNGIAVGRTSGERAVGTPDISEDYKPARACPHLVAPQKNLSRSTPVVAAAAALLVEVANKNPSLSSDPFSVKTKNYYGETIYNAGRAEVIKAVLMASADRRASNSSRWDISDYRVKNEHQTSNGLDSRFGAGQLNIGVGYHILFAGEQNCMEDRPETGGKVNPLGFDYDPAFGGSGGSNIKSSYFFGKTGKRGRLSATLAWNLDVSGGSVLHDLDLFLIDVTDNSDERVVASSESAVDNTETLWVELRPGRKYMLLVKPGAGREEPFKWDYALAWRLVFFLQ